MPTLPVPVGPWMRPRPRMTCPRARRPCRPRLSTYRRCASSTPTWRPGSGRRRAVTAPSSAERGRPAGRSRTATSSAAATGAGRATSSGGCSTAKAARSPRPSDAGTPPRRNASPPDHRPNRPLPARTARSTMPEVSTMWDDRPETGPTTRSRGADDVPSTNPRRARRPLPPGVAAGAQRRTDGALSGLPSSARDALPQPDHGAPAGPLTGAPRPDPGPSTDEPDRRVLPPLDHRRDLAPQLADAAARGLITAADVVAVLDRYSAHRRRSWITAPWTGRRGRVHR
jgi:hypothetical protein